MPKSHPSDFLVTIAGIAGTWSRRTGGRTTSEVTKHWDGGAREPEVLTSKPDHDDVTCLRGYDRVRDRNLARRLRPLVGSWETTITQEALDPDGRRTGDIERFHGRLTGVRAPEADANERTAVGDIELTFAISRIN